MADFRGISGSRGLYCGLILDSENPINMAKSFKMSVEAARLAYLSGPQGISNTAQATSSLTGFLDPVNT